MGLYTDAEGIDDEGTYGIIVRGGLARDLVPFEAPDDFGWGRDGIRCALHPGVVPWDAELGPVGDDLRLPLQVDGGFRADLGETHYGSLAIVAASRVWVHVQAQVRRRPCHLQEKTNLINTQKKI